MKNKKEILEEIEKEAPFLSQIKKENHFSTPENYLEFLPEVMNDKILNKNYLSILFDKLSYKIFIPVSAAIVLVFVILNFNTENISSELTSDQLSELIIDDEYFEIDDYLVYEAYAELLEEEENEATSENDEYINYLLENDIDINLIIEEL